MGRELEGGMNNMKEITIEEAIKRIKEFGLHHAIQDLPHSTYTVESFNMAIRALEIRMPMEADIHVDMLRENIISYCPRCHNGIDSYMQYCPSCGQRIFYNCDKFVLNGQKFEVSDNMFGRFFLFKDSFVIFMKEENSDMP